MTKTGNSLIVSNGSQLYFLRFPEKIEKSEFNPFRGIRTLKFAKSENMELKDPFLMTDSPVAIACSQYHYFLLFKDCLTVLSTINESVVKYFPGV